MKSGAEVLPIARKETEKSESKLESEFLLFPLECKLSSSFKCPILRLRWSRLTPAGWRWAAEGGGGLDPRSRAGLTTGAVWTNAIFNCDECNLQNEEEGVQSRACSLPSLTRGVLPFHSQQVKDNGPGERRQTAEGEKL